MRLTKDVGRWTDGRQRKVVENQRQGDRQAAAAAAAAAWSYSDLTAAVKISSVCMCVCVYEICCTKTITKMRTGTERDRHRWRCLAAHAQTAKRNPKQFGAKMCTRARQKSELKVNKDY